MKNELKTLNDLTMDIDVRGLYYAGKTDGTGQFIETKELKAEAIKWVKSFDKQFASMGNGREVFKHFFNITEEDLK